MTDSRICPYCQHANPQDAEQCGQCSQPMRYDTTIWKAGVIHDVMHPVPRTNFETNVLYLYVVGAQNQKPIRHQGKTDAILGRSADNIPSPAGLIDLNEYHAFSLGVSRQHAVLVYQGGGYTIEDLNSSNGTWLNGNRLLAGQAYPLRSGDHIQLGELLIFLYFT